MFFTGQKALVLAPHTDDAELGCGGTISKMLRSGVEVHIAAFSTAAESVPDGFELNSIKNEFEDSCRFFGIASDHVYIYDFPVRKLNFHRQEVLDHLVVLRTQIQPDIVFIPATFDLHQDHQVLSAEGLRAFKEKTLLGYELPWNHISFEATAFVELQDIDVENKWGSLQCYKTQLHLQRSYFTQKFVEGLAAVRGTQIKAKYAEAFQVLKVCL